MSMLKRVTATGFMRAAIVRARWVAILLCLAGTACSARSAESPRHGNTGDIRFLAVLDLSYDPLRPAVLGARPADPAEYPAVFYSPERAKPCTSTLVGPRALLTAAHCVGDGSSATLEVSGATYRSICSHSPDYQSNDTADWALCHLDRDLRKPALIYESVNTTSALLGEGRKLAISGFGCNNTNGSGDGIFRIGDAPITRLPHGINNSITTVGTVAICFGDSGGPAFAFLNQEGTKRVQVSVNSRGNILDTSLLSSLSTPAAVQFLRSWSASNRIDICGITSGMRDCR